MAVRENLGVTIARVSPNNVIQNVISTEAAWAHMANATGAGIDYTLNQSKKN